MVIQITAQDIAYFQQNYEYDPITGILSGPSIYIPSSKNVYIRVSAYMPSLGRKRTLLLHRVIYAMYYNKLSTTEFLDHIDLNKHNNAISNLRIATKPQNMQNTNKKKSGNNKYKCVCKRGNRFEAATTIQKHYIYLGRYDTAEEAALAYNDFAYKTFGQYARLNIITQSP
jgi:hypothetical protein